MESDRRLREYYGQLYLEAERLSKREGQLELVRTKELLLRHLPASPARIIDIGGGTGVYASWLASLGYSVHLVDFVPEHVEAALAFGTFSAEVGDARALSQDDESYDAALLLGPLYHLRSKGDRLQALREARRVVRKGGVVAAAFITRGAAVMDGFVSGWIYDRDALAATGEIVRGGLTLNDRTDFSAISYFHWPSEARDEVGLSGLTPIELYGIEGPGWIAPDFEERWQTEEGRGVILETARFCETEPQLQILSAHLLAFGRRD